MGALPDCTSTISEFTVARAVVAPGGSVQMTVFVKYVDGVYGCVPGAPPSCTDPYVHAYDITLTTIDGPTMAGGMVPTATVAHLEIPSTPGNDGEGSIAVTVTLPALTDAHRWPDTHDPFENSLSDGVFEMQASLVPVKANQYAAGERVALTGGLTVAGVTLSEWAGLGRATPMSDGTGRLPRELNGDLCVVPYGETSLAHGYVDGPAAINFAGRFGGHFKNADGSETSTPFDGRILVEHLTTLSNDTCWDQAVASAPFPTVRNPYVDHNCRDAGNVSPPPERWLVGWDGSVDPAVPVSTVYGHWGSCANENTTDNVGYHLDCATAYLQDYTNPPAINAAVPPARSCGVSSTQTMTIDCRWGNGWAWTHDYVSTPVDMKIWLTRTVSPVTRYGESERGPAVTRRDLGIAPVCVDPNP